ncbi:MAG: histone deacetylase [Alphaproteobacteria bacterium]|nr:histone deacetylase [Alphaproteobacteria bacterium]
MQVFHSDAFDLELPPGHRFPGRKYGMLRQKLLADGLVAAGELSSSPLVADEDLLRAHDAAYVRSIDDGTIDPAAMRRIGFPWSPQIAKRARATCGGALSAAHAALRDGVSGQLAGGTHHAHYDFGAGYCVFNDFAVAALSLLASRAVRRVAIIDLDVHQGDGNAAILGPRPDVFILSVHGEKNFPFRKFPSDLDVPLPDGVGDDAYLDTLQRALPAAFRFSPDIVLYQAGVDPLKEDRLGRMALSLGGLKARDDLVLRSCRRAGVPVSMAIGGGYADPIEASVAAYAGAYDVVRDIFG